MGVHSLIIFSAVAIVIFPRLLSPTLLETDGTGSPLALTWSSWALQMFRAGHVSDLTLSIWSLRSSTDFELPMASLFKYPNL